MPITISHSLDDLAAKILKASTVTVGDALYAGQHIEAGIREATNQGVDFQGNPFIPYNETDPYYYYPFASQNHSHEHMQRELGKLHKCLGGQRTKRGIKFVSYGAFKRAIGALGVNLYGPAAPHMLEAPVIKVNGAEFRVGADYDALDVPASTLILGIYDEKGKLAAIHNEGLGRQPERRFWELSQEAADRVIVDIETRITLRLNNL